MKRKLLIIERDDMFYHFSTVSAFYNSIRHQVSTLGHRDFKPFYDEKACLIGVKHLQGTYVIKVSTVRHFYNAIYEGDSAPKKEAQMFMRDLQSILEEKRST